MPTLPGLSNVPQGPYDRVLATFPGATQAEKTAAHREWLKQQYVNRVTDYELEKSREQTVTSTTGLLDGST